MNDTEKSKQPTHGVFHIRNRDGGEGFWTRIGSAWPNKDGLGFNIQLDFTPLQDGRISLRVLSEKK